MRTCLASEDDVEIVSLAHGKAMAARTASGIDVELTLNDGMIHGFLSLPVISPKIDTACLEMLPVPGRGSIRRRI
ncbi:MAG: hypothetical protein P1V21_07820 [Rhizobiaceae bacterium]|nr:hypothetical protein [Rhizobiaceae bacterium]